MKQLQIEKEIVEILSSQLSTYDFHLERLDFNNDHYAKFIRLENGIYFLFSISFLGYGKSMRIEPRVIASYDIITSLMQEVLSWNSDYNKGYPTMSADLGIFINPKNKDGFQNNTDYLEVVVSGSEDSIQKAVQTLVNKYFKKGVLPFVERTDSLEKANDVTNGWVKAGHPLNLLIYYPHMPWQMTSGLILSKLTNSPRYNEVLEVYQHFIREELSPDNERIKDFKILAEYFSGRGF